MLAARRGEKKEQNVIRGEERGKGKKKKNRVAMKKDTVTQ